MNGRFGLICAAAVVILVGGFAGEVKAQIVAITKANFTAAGGGNPPKANPQGTWSKPADNSQWKVEVDYGTVTAGAFTYDNTIGIGFTVFLPAMTTDGTWGPTGAESLKNPLPAGTNIRARLQKKGADGKWTDQGNPAYFPIP